MSELWYSNCDYTNNIKKKEITTKKGKLFKDKQIKYIIDKKKRKIKVKGNYNIPRMGRP